MRFFSPDEDSLVRHLKADENSDFQPQLEIPVHPLVPCFDFRKHRRIRVHVNNHYEGSPPLTIGRLEGLMGRRPVSESG